MKSILILQSTSDKNSPYICQKLDQLGEKHLVADLSKLSEISLSISTNKSGISGEISVRNEAVHLENIKSVLCRGLPHPGMFGGDEMTEKFICDEYLQTFFSLSTTLDTFWMNPPAASKYMLDHNKLYQLIHAERFGLLVPETIISNDPKRIISFCELVGGEVALKTVRSRMFDIGNNETEAIYTQYFTIERLRAIPESNIEQAPIMVQRYVPKKLELRVTVVDKTFFVCAIHSQDSEKTRHDWRHYDFENVRHEKFELPKKVEKQILAFIDHWKLKYAAIDMVLAPDDKLYFLEINPNGQFGWIEALTKMPITLAIAKALAKVD